MNDRQAPSGDTRKRSKRRAGYTLVEILMATSISGIVLAGVMTMFIWCCRQASLCAKMGWSQQEAMTTAAKLTMYMRNASAVRAIDTSEGMWIELGFPDGTSRRLSYSNAVPLLRDGRMYLHGAGETEMLVARGLTEIQASDGFTTPVFSQVGPNSVRVAFRVSEPTSGGTRAANDGPFAAAVRFAVCLRNVEE